MLYYRASHVTVYGTKYKKRCILAVRTENEDPLFGTVESIYISASDVWFNVEIAEVVEYNYHLHCYILKNTSIKEYVSQKCLLDFLPLHKKINPLIRNNFTYVVIPKYNYLL